MTEPSREPKGYVILPIAEYQTLIAARQPTSTSAWDALSATVGLLTAHISGTPATASEIAPDIPPERIAALLAVITTAALREFLPDHGASYLQYLGLLAASENPK